MLFMDTLFRYRQDGAFTLHAFVLMPDHFHILLTPAREITLERAVQLIKGGSARRIGIERQLRLPVWQRGFSDHRIRSAADYTTHLVYIEQNPVRKKLAVNPCEFRWSSASGKYALDPFPRGLKPPEEHNVESSFGTAEAVP
jgi:putative transposase